MADSGTAPSFAITGQIETVDLGPAGAYVQGVKVTFRTASGAIASVFVPDAQLTATHVRELIEAKAATLEAIAGLGATAGG